MSKEIESIRIEFIEKDPSRRALNEETVCRLMESINRVGLRTPITVRLVDGFVSEHGEIIDGQPLLVTGAHRLEAARRLGWEKIDCFVMDDDGIKARLWEIAENLHRSELTALQRDEHVAEWIRLTEEAQEISFQAEKKSKTPENPKGAGRKKGGVESARKELGISGADAHRAVKVASLSDEAKEAAREVHLDDNRSALLEAAKAPPEKQAEVLREIAEKKKAKPEPSSVQWTAEDEATYGDLLDAWEKATTAARNQFLRECSKKAA